MYGIDDLKPRLAVTEATVECPVRGCTCVVERQRRAFRRLPQFQCPVHGLFISPSTFEYAREVDNLLWCDSEDRSLLRKIKTVKRESRLARDNSEDAVTWNVFRFLERNQLLAAVFAKTLGPPIVDPHLIYWSYDQRSRGAWRPLSLARSAFGEQDQRGSEPDLIIESNEALIWVEAKLTARNETSPSNPDYSLPIYATSEGGWFGQVFRSDPGTLAIRAQLYELMRYWLLGSWIASAGGKAFYLVSLVRESAESDLEARVRPHLCANEQRAYMRFTWEAMYRQLLCGPGPEAERQLLLRYFENKSVGYREGVLQPAFSVPHHS